MGPPPAARGRDELNSGPTLTSKCRRNGGSGSVSGLCRSGCGVLVARRGGRRRARHRGPGARCGVRGPGSPGAGRTGWSRPGPGCVRTLPVGYMSGAVGDQGPSRQGRSAPASLGTGLHWNRTRPPGRMTPHDGPELQRSMEPAGTSRWSVRCRRTVSRRPLPSGTVGQWLLPSLRPCDPMSPWGMREGPTDRWNSSKAAVWWETPTGRTVAGWSSEQREWSGTPAAQRTS